MNIYHFPNYTIDLLSKVYCVSADHYLSQFKNCHGYLCVILFKNGKFFEMEVHKLMCNTYLPNYNNYINIKHKNNDKLDNRIYNLQWIGYTRNNSGYKNIITDRYHKTWSIKIIRQKRVLVYRTFSYSVWTLDEIVKIRNAYYKIFKIKRKD